MKLIYTNNIELQVKEIFENNKSDKIDLNYISNCSEDTKKLGMILAKYLEVSDILVLNGELGSGKTVLMSGIAKYFDIENQVSSPTFTIVNEYTTQKKLKDIKIFHFDVYRIKSLDEFLSDIGDDYFYSGICIIEWGNIIKDILPKKTIYIDILKDEKNELIRNFHIWRK